MESSLYWNVHQIDAYMNDAVAQLLASQTSKPLKTSHDIARYLCNYFQLVHSGHHILFRNYNFVTATFYNRGAFSAALYQAAKPVCIEKELLKVHEYYQLASLLCSDIPVTIFESLVKYLVLKDELHSRLSLGDFIYAFQALLCFGKLLDGIARIMGQVSGQPSSSSSNNVVVQLPTANQSESSDEDESVTSSRGKASINAKERVKMKKIEELFNTERNYVASCFINSAVHPDAPTLDSSVSSYSEVSLGLKCAYLLKIVCELAKYASFRFEKFFELFAYDTRVNRIVSWLPAREALLSEMKAAIESKKDLPLSNIADILRSDAQLVEPKSSSEVAQQAPQARGLPLSVSRNRSLPGKAVSSNNANSPSSSSQVTNESFNESSKKPANSANARANVRIGIKEFSANIRKGSVRSRTASSSDDQTESSVSTDSDTERMN